MSGGDLTDEGHGAGCRRPRRQPPRPSHRASSRRHRGARRCRARRRGHDDPGACVRGPYAEPLLRAQLEGGGGQEGSRGWRETMAGRRPPGGAPRHITCPCLAPRSRRTAGRGIAVARAVQLLPLGARTAEIAGRPPGVSVRLDTSRAGDSPLTGLCACRWRGAVATATDSDRVSDLPRNGVLPAVRLRSRALLQDRSLAAQPPCAAAGAALGTLRLRALNWRGARRRAACARTPPTVRSRTPRGGRVVFLTSARRRAGGSLACRT